MTEAVAAPVEDGPRSRLPHLPGLDGLRGLAVIAVLFFHGGFAWAKGGYLGVSVFFTLSGFLITNLLLAEWTAHGAISLRAFWARRFRRLLPAALLALLGIALYGWWLGSPEQLHALRIDVLAGLGYVANWRFVFEHKSYGDLFSAPSPVQHFWSLAIEEQFYVFYPLLAALSLRWAGRRRLASVLVVLLIGSLGASALLRASTDRVYYGTDTRMAELLAGALLAVWWSRRAHRGEAPRTRRGAVAVAVVGIAGLTGTIAMWPLVGQSAPALTRGVLPLQAALSTAAIAAAARPGVVSRLLARRPLVAVGRVSYGLYLYHWPVFLALDESRVDLAPVPLFVVRMAVTTALTLLSYQLVEQPIRRRRVLHGIRQVAPALVAGVAAVAVLAVAVTLDPPASTLAYADVDLADQTVVVHGEAPRGVTPTPAASALTAPGAVMIVGDSGTYDAAPAIVAQYRAMGTAQGVDVSFPGFGLSRNPAGWKEDWPKLVEQYRPGLVVVLLGGWDEGYVKEQGRQRYQELADDAIAIWTAQGAEVLWLGMLQGGKGDATLMDPVFRSIAAAHPGVVQYGTVDQVLQDRSGGHPRWLRNEQGELVLARKPDGWHLCPDGAARIGRAVARITASLGWTPPPVDGWQDDPAWRSTARYDDPRGGCDTSSPSNAPPN
jgi:peptidoglycan/LPS O-acetylase OafA/YrhL